MSNPRQNSTLLTAALGLALGSDLYRELFPNILTVLIASFLYLFFFFCWLKQTSPKQNPLFIEPTDFIDYQPADSFGLIIELYNPKTERNNGCIFFLSKRSKIHFNINCNYNLTAITASQHQILFFMANSMYIDWDESPSSTRPNQVLTSDSTYHLLKKKRNTY